MPALGGCSNSAIYEIHLLILYMWKAGTEGLRVPETWLKAYMTRLSVT